MSRIDVLQEDIIGSPFFLDFPKTPLREFVYEVFG
jgi:hypothetical protein